MAAASSTGAKARARTTATEASSADASVAMIGSSAIFIDARGEADPSGDVHLVDESWLPTCGGTRVHYIFPGRDISTAAGKLCDTCATASRRAKPSRSKQVA